MKRKSLYIQKTKKKGQGVFTSKPIQKGELVIYLSGFVIPTQRLKKKYLALQIDHDMWLCSIGDKKDDMINHSCAPNTGFKDGGLKLYALRNIEQGEEITFDYSTSISDTEWSLDCKCGAARCRETVRPFQKNGKQYRKKNLPLSLDYIRKSYCA